jgi:hypothetical protein
VISPLLHPGVRCGVGHHVVYNESLITGGFFWYPKGLHCYNFFFHVTAKFHLNAAAQQKNTIVEAGDLLTESVSCLTLAGRKFLTTMGWPPLPSQLRQISVPGASGSCVGFGLAGTLYRDVVYRGIHSTFKGESA